MAKKKSITVDIGDGEERDLHPCPDCGKLYECEGVTVTKQSRHWINCAEHGQGSLTQAEADGSLAPQGAQARRRDDGK